MPLMRSAVMGFFLWGIADDPFCPLVKPSAISPISVRWRLRTSVANFSMELPMSASEVRNSAWRSRWTTCVETSATPRPSFLHTAASIFGSRLAKLPTAPEILPTAALLAARRKVSRRRVNSVYQTANFSPTVVGSASTPCVRPMQGVILYFFASPLINLRATPTFLSMMAAARLILSDSAVSSISEEVMPK